MGEDFELFDANRVASVICVCFQRSNARDLQNARLTEAGQDRRGFRDQDQEKYLAENFRELRLSVPLERSGKMPRFDGLDAQPQKDMGTST